MNQQLDIFVVLVVSLIMIMKPRALVNFSNTLLGRLVLITLIILTTYHSTLSGIFVALLTVYLFESIFETFENNNKDGEKHDDDKEDKSKEEDKETSDEVEEHDTENDDKEELSSKDKFTEKHCKKDEEGNMMFMNDDGEKLSLEEIEKKYPNIKFEKDKCNPCDVKCNFDLIELDEQLRPKNSNEIEEQEHK